MTRLYGLSHRFAGVLPIVCSVLVAMVLFSLGRNIRSYLTASSSDFVASNNSGAEAGAGAGAEAEPEAEPEAAPEAADYIVGIFDANDASGILVTNMSLVFSILYGFIFNRAYQRFDDISRVFSSEVANLHQLVNLIRLIDFDMETQRELLVRLRHYAFQIRHEIRTGEVMNASHSVDDLYALIPVVKKLVTIEHHAMGTTDNNGDTASDNSVAFDKEMLNSSLESIKSLLEARYERWDLFSKNIHSCLKWLLILSANLTFFGVMLMQSGSSRIDFLYCCLTIVSIACIMAALSDLDQFFAGNMKIETSDLDHLFHFSGSASGDEEAIESWEPLRAMKVVRPNLKNSRRFAEHMMSEASTNKLRNRTFKEVSESVLKDIRNCKKRQGQQSLTKYAVEEAAGGNTQNV
eukprot:g2669.t1